MISDVLRCSIDVFDVLRMHTIAQRCSIDIPWYVHDVFRCSRMYSRCSFDAPLDDPQVFNDPKGIFDHPKAYHDTSIEAYRRFTGLNNPMPLSLSCMYLNSFTPFLSYKTRLMQEVFGTTLERRSFSSAELSIKGRHWIETIYWELYESNLYRTRAPYHLIPGQSQWLDR